MSTLNVEVVRIDSVSNHPGADRLDLLTIKGWQVVSAKNNFKQGDLAVYFPIDAVLPVEIETKIFGIDSKVKLHNSRVKTIKLRGAISQGLAVRFETLNIKPCKLGTDLTKTLNITKYEAPVKSSSNMPGAITKKKHINPYFRKYTGIENAKNFTQLFQENEEVIVSEKIHGANWRAAVVPYSANTLWKKIKKFFKSAPEYEFVFGSHNIQLQDKLVYKGYYDKNIYAEMVKKYNIKEILKPNEAIYGEVYGDGVQKGYAYGCKANERKLIFFEVKINEQWLSPMEAKKWFEERHLPFVPLVYIGPFNREKILSLTQGNSLLAPTQKIREGVVVRPLLETQSYIGRKMLKFISDEFLMRTQDDDSQITH